MSAIAISSSSQSSAVTYNISPPSLTRGRQIKKFSFSGSVKAFPVMLGKVILRIVVVATAILFSPLLAFAWGIANVGYAISRKSAFRKELVDARDKMKLTEESRKFEALKKVSTELLVDSSKIKIDLRVKLQKLLRELLRAEARKGECLQKIIPEAIKNFCFSLKDSDFETVGALNQAFQTHGQPALNESVYQAIIDELKLGNMPGCAEKLGAALKNISNLLQSSPKDIATTNRLITKYLRQALENPFYIAIKENNECAPVVFLHSLAASMWTQTRAFDAYQELGKACLSPVSNQSPMHERLFTSHQAASQKLLTDHGLKAKLFYAFTHPKQALSSLASEGGLAREVAASFGFGTYDSHGELSNNPSLQGTTSVRAVNFSGKVLNSYGGSPTQGDHKVAPEFRAVCQAAENNLFSSRRIEQIPDMIYYTNLQHIEGRHGEGDRSHTIMSLAYDFPLSFRGMTLAKDSEFYMMRKNRNSLQWNPEEFSSDFLAKLQHEVCYTFEGRQGTTEGNGIYLPGKKEEWQPVLASIFKQARSRFESLKAENSEQAYRLRGAFIEYVYSMIQAYMEVNILLDVKSKLDSDPLVMTISACKENIDRGGMANVVKLHTRLPEGTPEEERLSLLAGAMHSRALSARNRVILPSRMPQSLAFIEFIQPRDFKDDLHQFFKELGVEVDSFTFEPALQRAD